MGSTFVRTFALGLDTDVGIAVARQLIVTGCALALALAGTRLPF